MAKDILNGKGKTIIAVFVLVATVVAAFVWAQADIKAGDTKADMIIADADDLKIEGCNPAGKNKFDIALIQKDIKTIQTSQKEMRKEQTVGFKEILDRLPE